MFVFLCEPFFIISFIPRQVFTSEDVDLPHQDVADYLDGIDPQICARYLEYLIDERNETGPVFHDRLAELYLSMVLAAKRKGDESNNYRILFPRLKWMLMRCCV